MSEIRVLVFGTAGSGKTSLCNALTNENELIGDGAKGVTLDHHKYKTVELNDKSVSIIDTVGLNESDKGAVKARTAIKLLINLLRDSQEGYSLLVHVFRKGRPTKAEVDNYRLFVNAIAGSTIPVISVVTGCEDVEPMSNWSKINYPILEELGLKYQDVVCTCFATSGKEELNNIYQSLREDSVNGISNSIIKYAAKEPVKIYKDANEFIAVMKRTWNQICELCEVPDWTWNVEKNLAEILKRIGFPAQEIRELLRDFNLLINK
jgi:GTPase SAR1 family protein